jgi:aspartyl-tRNA(Asn)/glutamyl-tRNA(Gln) amidotransferase subunit B
LPGALPVPNKKAIEWTILLGTALGCKINSVSKFDRKNYFYPDLPKGYQISQYDEPIAVNGLLKFEFQNSNGVESEKTVRIRRVHLEEDTGKLIHAEVNGKSVTLVDFNRSGVPLVEIVTEPDIQSSQEAKAFLKEIQKIIRYLKISEADMEKGIMRLEPSISLREVGSDPVILPPYRVEIKNINSFRFAQRAIDYEIDRQKKLLEAGEKIPQETRGWSESKGVTLYQRSKEEAHAYRYFPEPDIPPLFFSEEYIDGIVSVLPELPLSKSERFVKQYEIKVSDASILTEDEGEAELFEELVRLGKDKNLSPQRIANLLVNKKIGKSDRGSSFLIEEMLKLNVEGTEMSGETLVGICREVIALNQEAVGQLKSGKEKALDFLVGQVFRRLKGQGRADPDLVGKKILEIITNG